MDLDLAGARILVTGAARGIGEAVCVRLLDEGATVVALDREPVTRAGVEAHRVDLADPASRDELVASLAGSFDGLVLAAGIAPTRTSGAHTPLAEWMRTFEVDLFANVAIVGALVDRIRVDRSGAIVGIGSTAARLAEPSFIDYGAAKSALRTYFGALATELGPRGIRALLVSPGSTRTPLWDEPGGYVDALAAHYGMSRDDAVTHHVRTVRGIALGRPATADEIADVVVFALSQRASFVAGTSIDVHGATASHLM